MGALDQIPELRRLFATARLYLDGQSSIQELNSSVGYCLDVAKFGNVSPHIVDLLIEWELMINRCWNECNSEKSPLSEAEFSKWLREQLVFG